MQLLISLVFLAPIFGISCGDESFECYQECEGSVQSSTIDLLSICKRAGPDIDSCDTVRCYQKCPKSNLTNVLDEAASVLNEYCAKGYRFVNALKANVGELCNNWHDQFDHSCKGMKGCDKAACTFDKAVNDIAFAYTEDSVKYATSFVKFLLGRALATKQDDLPVEKGCDIVYRPWNASNGIRATGVVLTLAWISSLIHAL